MSGNAFRENVDLLFATQQGPSRELSLKLEWKVQNLRYKQFWVDLIAFGVITV